MGKKFLFFSILFCIFIALSGCTGSTQVPILPADTIAQEGCVWLCNAEKEKGTDLSSGPCIGNPIPGKASDYACDVAHSPRSAIDDLQENQCSAYGEGKAKHFVEVDSNCNVIKIA